MRKRQPKRILNVNPSPKTDEDWTFQTAEEADMAQWWLPFEDAVDAVLSGRITDSLTVAGILAAQVLRTR